MRRLLPYPLLTLALLAMWLLLNQSLSASQLLLGSAIAITSSLATRALGTGPPRIKSWRPLPRILLLLVADIFRSNVAVAKIILLPRSGAHKSAFIKVPLEIQNHYAQAFLAIMMTATPGTLWVQFDRVEGILLVHILDEVGADAWMDRIKGRYEPLLLDMFA